MPLTKSVGNMYQFITYHWNPIKGRCYYREMCRYCYVPHTRAARYYEGEPKLIEKELKVNLGKGNRVFCGSMIDMWHDKIPSTWISYVLEHCRQYPENEYLFQSKNPERFFEFQDEFPFKTILATTIEGTEELRESVRYIVRAGCLREARNIITGRTMLSIEPILKFKFSWLTDCIKLADPELVVIGADSKRHGLIEPTASEVKKLINYLKKKKYKVILKDNLGRIVNDQKRL